jgi:hypothetical protein
VNDRLFCDAQRAKCIREPAPFRTRAANGSTGESQQQRTSQMRQSLRKIQHANPRDWRSAEYRNRLKEERSEAEIKRWKARQAGIPCFEAIE